MIVPLNHWVEPQSGGAHLPSARSLLYPI